MPPVHPHTLQPAPAKKNHSVFLCLIRLISRNTAPTDMPESATLKAGQWWVETYTSMKSTTSPNLSRSMRLPIAPAKISESESKSGFCRYLVLLEVKQDHRDGADRHGDKKDRPEISRHLGQETEGRAGVADMHEVKETADYGNRVVEAQICDDQLLCQLVERNHNQSDQRKNQVAFFHYQDCRFVRQRLQTPGNSGLAPTVSLSIQHLWHFPPPALDTFIFSPSISELS